MPEATIVKVSKQDGQVHVAVRVTEADGANVEYIGTVPLSELAGLTLAQQKAKLVAAVKAVRDGLRGAAEDVAMSGTVTV